MSRDHREATGDTVDAIEIAARAEKGDADADATVERYAGRMARGLAASMTRAAHGLDGAPPGSRTVADLRAYEAIERLLDELERWGERLSAEEVLHALERARVRPDPVGEPGRVSVVELDRARTRLAEVVFVLGLEGGSLPRRGAVSPFLDDEHRRELDERRGTRLLRPDPVGRDRYLLYTACTRATRRLTLVREAAGDDGAPRDASPFWDETRSLFPERRHEK